MKQPLLFMRRHTLAFVLLLSAIHSTAQSFSGGVSITLEANTSTQFVTGNGLGSNCIFPNGKIGILMNSNTSYRVYNSNGSLANTINLTAVAGFTPAKVIGLSNNRLLLLRITTFMIIDLQGTVITAETSTGLDTYGGGGSWLDAVELSNGNIAFSIYAADGSNKLRVFTQAGIAVSAIVNAKTTGTGRPTPFGNQYYQGRLAASKDGGFLFVYTTYYAGVYGILFDNDCNMNTWPVVGTNHRMLFVSTGQDWFDICDLPNGSYMLQLYRSKTANIILSSSGVIQSTSILRIFDAIGALAINRPSLNGFYASFMSDETIGINYSPAGNFTGNANWYAEARNLDGSVRTSVSALGVGYYQLVWDEDWWDFNPNIRPGLCGVSSLRGGSGGFGVIIQNYAVDGIHFSLTLHLWGVGMSSLPIKLESFTGKKSGVDNLLEWKTSSEINAHHFEIEYAADGANFSKVGTVATGSQSYSFRHNLNEQERKQPAAYYRLRMVDADGKYEYSKVVRLSNESVKGVVLVYPVPAKGNCTVEITDFKAGSALDYSLISGTGTVVANGTIRQSQQQLDLHQLAPGTYYLKVAGYEAKTILVR